jgi:hypothetical protein
MVGREHGSIQMGNRLYVGNLSFHTTGVERGRFEARGVRGSLCVPPCDDDAATSYALKCSWRAT